MSRLKSLLHVANPSTCNTQQKLVQVCKTVAQHAHITQQAEFDVETGCSLHQEEELRRLVRLVSDHHGFSQEDYEEALTHALRDPINALTCFTSLARQAELI
jgi:hypothetical protein